MTKYEIAKAHAKNRKKITQAIKHLNRSLNQAIKDNNEELQYVNIRTMIILYGAYLESSLGYIVNFYGAQISDKARVDILNQNSEIKKWDLLIDNLFKKHYLSGKKRAFNLINLGHTNFHRYEYLKKLLDTDIRSIVEIRNKLAHGQWAIAFTNEGDNTNQDVTTKLWTLTKKDLLFIKNITKSFVTIVEKLVASNSEFTKTFDEKVHALESTKEMHEDKYNWIISELKRKKRPKDT